MYFSREALNDSVEEAAKVGKLDTSDKIEIAKEESVLLATEENLEMENIVAAEQRIDNGLETNSEDAPIIGGKFIFNIQPNSEE